MKFYIAIVLTAVVLLASSCSFFNKTPAEGENVKNTPAAVDNSNTESKPNEEVPEVLSKDAKATKTQIEAKDASQTGLGPTDSLRAFNDAVLKKDAAKIKSFLSRGSIKLISDSAREQGKTVDNILTADDGAPMPEEREMQNETIEGNVATVEVKNSVMGNYDKMFLVKEDGNWRVALDKFRDEMLRKLDEMQKTAPKPKP